MKCDLRPCYVRRMTAACLQATDPLIIRPHPVTVGNGAIPTPWGEGTRTREPIFHIMLGLGRVPVTVRTGRQSPDPLTDQHVKPTRSLCLLGGKAGTQNPSPRTLHKDRNITGLLSDFSN